MENLTRLQLSKKYENIEDKIPSSWETYEKAGIELAQDLSFGHWDIRDAELYRVISLVSTRVPGLRITQHLDSKFSFMGLYPHTQKADNIFPEGYDPVTAENVTKEARKYLAELRKKLKEDGHDIQ